MPSTDLSVVVEAILLEADGPQLVLAHDVLGTKYLSMLVDVTQDGDRFLSVAVSPKRLADLRSGAIDLRSAYLAPEQAGEIFQGLFRRVDDVPTIQLVRHPEVQEAWLPGEGLFLAGLLGADEASLVAEAIALHSAIVECTLDPPEARTEPRINSGRLAAALDLLGTLVTHAIRKVAGPKPRKRRSLLDEGSFDPLQVYAFSPGSFRVHLRSSADADLVGESDVGRALALVDDLTALVDSPSLTEQVAVANRGHVLFAYHSLLKFVAEENVPLSYRWADPSSSRESGRVIKPLDAARVSEILESRKELSIEEETLVGYVTKVDATTGKWTLQDDERSVKGQIAEGSGSLLDGLVVKTSAYRFLCDVKLEEVIKARRPTRRYYLKAVRPVESGDILA